MSVLLSHILIFLSIPLPVSIEGDGGGADAEVGVFFFKVSEVGFGVERLVNGACPCDASAWADGVDTFPASQGIVERFVPRALFDGQAADIVFRLKCADVSDPERAALRSTSAQLHAEVRLADRGHVRESAEDAFVHPSFGEFCSVPNGGRARMSHSR